MMALHEARCLAFLAHIRRIQRTLSEQERRFNANPTRVRLPKSYYRDLPGELRRWADAIDRAREAHEARWGVPA